MPVVTLPPEVISLVHHIELNRAGWWDRAIQRLVLAAIWLSGKPLSAQEIIDYYRREFQVNIDFAKLNSQIDILCSSNILVPLPKQDFKISEEALKGFENQLKEAEEVETKARGRFLEVLEKCCPSLPPEETWQMVNKKLILPMIQMMGARTYELISGSIIDLDKDTTFQDYLEGYPAEIRKHLRVAINTFLNPKDIVVRSYILNYLNSFFFLEAGNLKEDTLRAITKLSSLKPSFIVFVDTNFLFSILELHENPSNEAALLLKELIKQLSGTVSVKLYVLPSTIDETRNVLIAYKQYLKELRLTPNLAEASLDTGLSGIVQKYFDEYRKVGQSLSAELYFDPYIKDLISIIRSKGVEFFNEKIDQYKTDQKVIDDILSQREFEKTRFGPNAKSYEQLRHDMILWHFVRDKRPIQLESPLDAKYWIVTVDFRFLGFDAFKKKKLQETVQTCLHPTTLIQMLQFWIPRSPKFEEAMLSSMRLPFLFQEFDPNVEKITIRILETLGRFENIGDLSKETITAILMKDALRQKLAVESDITKRIELVKEALIEENQKTQHELKETRDKAESLKREVDEKDEIIKRIKEEEETLRKKLIDTEHLLDEEHKERQKLGEMVHQLKEDLLKKKEKEGKRIETRQFTIKWFISPILLIGLCGGIIPEYFLKSTRLGYWGSAIGIWSLLLIFWVWLADKQGLKIQTVKDWPLFNTFHKFKRWLFFVLGTVVLGVIINALWDLIKQLLNLGKI